jgi:integrase
MAGDGTLYQRKPGSNWYWIYNTGEKIINKKGKEVYEQIWYDLETTDKKEAKDKRDNIKADIVKKGRYDKVSNDTFGKWLDTWLDQIEKPKIEQSTYDFYEYIIRVHIKPKLGATLLKKLHPEELQKFFNQKRTEKKLSKKKDEKGNYIPSNDLLSKRTLKGIETVVYMALTKAVGMRKIPDNPMTGLDRIEYKRENVKYMTTDQVADFLDKIKDDPLYNIFITVFGSGVRLSELVALKHDDIDFDKEVIRIDKGAVEVKTYAKEGPKTEIIVKNPKSEKGKRTIPIPNDVILALQRQKELQQKEGVEWEKQRLKEQKEREEKPNKKSKRKYIRPEYFKSGYVFTRKDGHRYTPNYLSKYFLELTRKYGFEGLTFHTQRHSYASMLLEAGENLKVIQENLGDATLQVVSDTYTHVAEKLKKKAAEKLNGFTNKKQTEAR